MRKVFKKNPLYFLYQTDTLVLTAHFSECGEYGGHKEKFIIFCNYKNEYFAKYTRDSINLNCTPDFAENAVVIKDTSFQISISDEKLIRKYLDKLYKNSFTNSMHHSSNYYEAYTRGKLRLSAADSERKWNDFRKLQIKLLK